MKSLERMVVGLMRTDSDLKLVEYACMLCEHGIVNQLEFVHVVNDNSDTHREDFESLLGELQATVRPLLAKLSSPPGVAFAVLTGAREDALCEYIERKEIGAILLGHNTKRSSGKRALARRLAMISQASVWMVPDTAACKISRVLAPVDFSSHSADSLSIAAGISSKMGLDKCYGLHVYYDSSVFRFDDHDTVKKGEEKAAFSRFVRPLNTYGVRVDEQIEEGSNVARTILRFAVEQDHDLIVLNTRGRSRAAAVLLGSETSQVMMESPVPVLAIKHRGAQMNIFEVLTSEELWRKTDADIHS